MPNDPLKTVLRLRQRGVDDAKRNLAASLAIAAEAASTLHAAECAIEQEAERASDPDGGDHLVEAFAAWLPGARHRTAQARALHERHEADVGRRRAELAASRTALESVESLLTQCAAIAAADEARRIQHALDEAAGRLTKDQDAALT